MSIDKPYTDMPGTTVFDTDQMRKGYWLNQFCVSLMKAENRERFKANERAYLDEWKMSEEQKQAVLDRDLNRCVELEVTSTSLPGSARPTERASSTWRPA